MGRQDSVPVGLPPQPAHNRIRGLAAAVEVALASAMIFFAAAQFTSARQFHARLGPLLAVPRPASGTPAIRDLAGLDIHGLPAGVHVGAASDIFAAFVLRDATAASDTAYWNAVASYLQQRVSKVSLVGFCDSENCARSVASRANFPVIAYAENVVLLRMRDLVQPAQVLEMNGMGREAMQFSWSQQLPSVTAAELAGQIK